MNKEYVKQYLNSELGVVPSVKVLKYKQSFKHIYQKHDAMP